MEQLQVPNEQPKDCGCGGKPHPTIVNDRPLTEQQQKLVTIIQRVNQRKNAIYKTKTSYFM